MRLHADTATEAATLAAGDPVLAAPYLDDRRLDGLAEAAEAGALWSASTGRDGAFPVLVLVDEAPSPDLAPHLRDRREGRLELPAGVLRVAGAEAFLPGALAAPPAGVGVDLAVPPGAYALEGFRVEAPAGLRLARVAARTSPLERAAWRAAGLLAAAGAALLLVALLGGAIWVVRRALGATPSPGIALWPVAATGACAALSGVVRGTRWHRAAAAAWRDAGRDLPAAVLVLRREGAARATPAAAPPRRARS